LVFIAVLSASNGFAQTPAWTIEVHGTVEENDKKLAGAVITLLDGNGNKVTSYTSPNGSFTFTLNNDINYTLTFTKPGYITKRLAFSTMNVPPDRSKYGFSPYSDIEVNIFPEIPGTDVDQILMQPIGKIGYDASFHNGDFTFDAQYTASIQSLLDKILAAQKAAAEKAKQLELQYKKAIAKADQEFGAKNYADAKTDYTSASGLKPAEQYPKDQLAAIEKAMAADADAAKKAAAEKALQNKYDSLVRIGDNAFKAQSYPAAKAAYNSALQVKADQQYPKNQLAAIDKAIADAAGKAATQKKYDSLIAIGDNAFKSKSYSAAKDAYNGAIRVKGDEQYPKTQLAAIDKAMADDADAAKKAATQKKYDSLVALGDNAFKGKNYKDAKDAYNKALLVKPEQYPKDQLAAIDKAIADEADASKKAAIQKKYDSLVAIADNSFKSKNYSNAKTAYNAALGVKPTEQYPKDQIAAIDKTIADEADASRKAAVKKKYDSLVVIGDKAFQAKSYNDAKSAYNKAIQVKPDETYPKNQLAAIDKAVADAAAAADAAKKDAAQKALQRRYDSIVAIGDNAFKAKSYTAARTAYNNALNVKPDETYPKDQMAAIDKAIADAAAAADAAKKDAMQKALQRKYDSLVALGDNAFKNKSYADAKNSYNKALQVKADEQYPKDQLAAIDKAIADAASAADAAKRDAAQKALQRRYDSIIAIGDNAFKTKAYPAAKNAYNTALSVKPNEQYPKDQLAAIDKAIADDAAAADAAKKDAAQKAMQRKYDSLVAVGDNAFKNNNYNKARASYNGALNLKPTEQYPKDQLAAIQSALDQQKANEAQYNQLISSGNQEYFMKKYTTALATFKQANALRPNEQMPKDRIAAIEQLLQNQQNQSDAPPPPPPPPKDTTVAVDPSTPDSVASKYAQGITEESGDQGGCQITKRIVVKGKRGWIYIRKSWNFGTYYFKASPPDYTQVAITEDTWNNETANDR
jgi:hypothetical protein